MKKQKLELTWIGKDEQPRLEPRILIEDPEKSYTHPLFPSQEGNLKNYPSQKGNRKSHLLGGLPTPSPLAGGETGVGLPSQEGPGVGNMLIHGDNLLALKALEQDFAGKIKCIYIDPPYNTGNAFEHYDDGLEHSIWLSLMKPRIEIIHK
ncbi:MAG TPA: DNA methyltransferase, partial [Candidatus Brocadiales bacterium]|nr:DNA methyltransferase [Candidatus Brocadiales bacterium]